jgi:anti-anti-sigma factor
VSDLVGLHIEERDDAVVATLTGELDLAGAARTRDSISQAVPTSARALVLDMTDLEFIDSSGVAMIFALARRLGSRRQEVHLAVRPGGPVERVLGIVGVEKAVNVHPDVDRALAGGSGSS